MGKRDMEKWGEVKKAFRGEFGDSALHLTVSDKGQIFAGITTIRQAIADVIDAGDGGPWALYEDDPVTVTDLEYAWTEDLANEERGRFMDAVIKRITELQSPPHDGIRLENLCPRHRREALPVPTAAVCGMCQAERGNHG